MIQAARECAKQGPGESFLFRLFDLSRFRDARAHAASPQLASSITSKSHETMPCQCHTNPKRKRGSSSYHARSSLTLRVNVGMKCSQKPSLCQFHIELWAGRGWGGISPIHGSRFRGLDVQRASGVSCRRNKKRDGRGRHPQKAELKHRKALSGPAE